jgi:hypothetical protein
MSTDILRTNLLHASGQEMVMLGGDVYEQLTKGDITHEYKWRNGEPIMLIYKRVLGRNTPAYMIEMKDAHQYAMSNGGPTKALLSKLCMEAAQAIGVEHDKASIYRIIDVIVEGMDILLKMPPEPKAIEVANRPSTGNDELCIKIDGKVIAEVQL